MTDIQILTIALTLLGIFAASWFNKGRISDLNRRIDDMRDVLRAEMKMVQAELLLQFERTNNKIDSLLKLVADINQRGITLESRK